MKGIFSLAAAVALCLAWPGAVRAQYTTIFSPFNTANDSFFETIGVGWQLNLPGAHAQFMPGGPAPAPFGGGEAGAGGGIGLNFAGPNGSFNLTAAQGSQSSLVGTSAGVTIGSGQTGFVGATEQRPFVIGFVPVVGFGSGPPLPTGGSVSPLSRRLAELTQSDRGANSAVRPAARRVSARPEESSHDAWSRKVTRTRNTAAGQPIASVEQIRRVQQDEEIARQTAALQLAERGRRAAEAGSVGAARIYYQQALRRAQGELRHELQHRLQQLSSRGQGRSSARTGTVSTDASR